MLLDRWLCCFMVRLLGVNCLQVRHPSGSCGGPLITDRLFVSLGLDSPVPNIDLVIRRSFTDCLFQALHTISTVPGSIGCTGLKALHTVVSTKEESLWSGIVEVCRLRRADRIMSGDRRLAGPGLEGRI